MPRPQSACSCSSGPHVYPGTYWHGSGKGKGHDRLIYLRQDVAQAVHAYFEARGGISADALGLP
jgi:hypothetical protein